VCLTLPFNLGVGGALRTGFQYAVRHNYQRAIQFDADGQHDPTQIAAILQALDNGADMAIGSRFLGTGDYQVGRSRGAAMGILRWSITKLAGQKFTDTSSGFRAFNEPVIEFFAKDMPIGATPLKR
jgi:glycosyltransferase involved in cell wall biosynthesis